VHAVEALIDAIEHGRPEPRIDYAFAERHGMLAKLAEWRGIAEQVMGAAAAERTNAQ
jgi:hypothetical protein